jgi:hypothetical protein
MISTISIHTQNLIKQIKEEEQKESDLLSYSEFVEKLTKNYEDIIVAIDKQYNKANDEYVKLHISESENKNLSDDIQYKILLYGELRSKHYFKIMEYRGKINMLNNMYNAYIDMIK